jgi:hypothetical protein
MSHGGIDILKAVTELLKIDYDQVSDKWSIELDKEQLQRDFAEKKLEKFRQESD